MEEKPQEQMPEPEVNKETTTEPMEETPKLTATRRTRNKVEDTVRKVTKQTLFVSFGTFLAGMLVMFGIVSATSHIDHNNRNVSSNQFEQQINRNGRSQRQFDQNDSNRSNDAQNNQNDSKSNSSDTISGASEHT